MKKKSPLEDVESTLFTSWLRGNNLLNGHVPNETPTKRKIVTPEWKTLWVGWHKRNARNRAVGVVRGIPDHFVIIPAERCTEGRQVLLVVEMKREDGVPSDVSPEQEEWLQAFNGVKDVESFVAFGAKQAILFVSQYLIDPKKYDF